MGYEPSLGALHRLYAGRQEYEPLADVIRREIGIIEERAEARTDGAVSVVDAMGLVRADSHAVDSDLGEESSEIEELAEVSSDVEDLAEDSSDFDGLEEGTSDAEGLDEFSSDVEGLEEESSDVEEAVDE